MTAKAKREYFRPFWLALVFSAAGEMTYFIVWGLLLFSSGSLLAKLFWTAACTLGMAALIGISVKVLVFERLTGMAAFVGSAIFYFLVLATCTLICLSIDLRFDYFGGASAPILFVVAGFIPAALTAPLYAWLLHGHRGKETLARLGL